MESDKDMIESEPDVQYEMEQEEEQDELEHQSQEQEQQAKPEQEPVPVVPATAGIKVSSISSVINEPTSSPSEPTGPTASMESSSSVALEAGNYSSADTTPPLSASTASSASSSSMQLNDAFAYLDKVRAEFADQPEVYNKFLQVMREFKANTIDANGVIIRVVQLFKGHRNLILGFNAFLPKTHHIDPNIQDFSRWAQNLEGFSGSNSAAPVASTAATSSSQYPPHSSHQAQPQPHSVPLQPAAYRSMVYSGAGTASMTASSASAGGPGLGGQAPSAIGPSPAVVRGSSSQFNRAVGFVEKIKNRFSQQPETYRAFLSLLHSFHRDQRGVREVYAQVQQLFRSEPDILEEFSLFLPSSGAAAAVYSSASPIVSGAANASIEGNSFSSMSRPGSTVGVGLPPVGRFPGRGRSAASSTVVGALGSHVAAASTPSLQGPPKRPYRPGDIVGGMQKTTSDETEFFDRVKKFLGNRQIYAEFLKCLSLFSQDILKLPDLITMVHGFIGGNEELFSWFKRYINYRENTGGTNRNLSTSTPTATASIPSTSSAAASARSFAEAQVPELNVAALKRVGSYRLYPRGYRLCRASGRTILCEEVLNDEMLSAATFESEDAGFLSSKKNQYEDALFKCEDERFEMDLLLEYNSATIAVLEPLARRLEAMDLAQRGELRLDARLNGTSEIIYKKAIRRVYGPDKGDEVYEYLQRSPSAAVPVVLRRLKAKEEEWRRVQRDWNRVWSEIHLKNYYKALDHQGIDFKVSDRKSLTPRTLLQEVITAREEQRRRPGPPAGHGGRSAAMEDAQLTMGLNDGDLLKDLLKLIDVTIQSSSSLSGTDRKSLSRFFSTFVPEFFAVVHHACGDAMGVGSEAEDGDSQAEAEETSAAGQIAAPQTTTPQTTAAPSSSLLYANLSLFSFIRLFCIAYERLERMKLASVSAQNRPFFQEKTNVVAQFLDLQSRTATMTVQEELAHAAQAGGEAPGGDFYGVTLLLTEQLIEGDCEAGLFEEKLRYMFGTGGFVMFTFDKLLLTLLRQTLTVLNDVACENLIRLYDSWQSRRGLSEYSARLAAESIICEAACSNGNGAAAGGSPILRIELSGASDQGRTLTVHLLDRLQRPELANGISAAHSTNSSSLATAPTSAAATATIEERWSVYVDNFVKLEANPAYLNPASRPFLHRNLSSASKSKAIAYNLECKICINTYKIFYVENTEDFLVAHGRKMGVCRGADVVKELLSLKLN